MANCRRALLGGDCAGGAEDAGHLGGEVPAAGEDLRDRAVRDQLAVPQQHDPLREHRCELDVVRGHHDARPPLRQLAGPAGQRLLAGPVHPSRRLVEADESGESPTPRAAGHHQSQRQALALAAGQIARIGLRRPPEPHRGKRLATGLAGQLVRDPLANQQVARALGEKRAAARRRDPPPSRVDQSGGRPQERGLAGTVTAHQRNPFAAGDREVDPPQDVACPAAVVELHPEVRDDGEPLRRKPRLRLRFRRVRGSDGARQVHTHLPGLRP